MANRWEDVRARMNLDESGVARRRERMERDMHENTDGRGNPVGAGVALVVTLIFGSACLYGVWFASTHWHAIWP